MRKKCLAFAILLGFAHALSAARMDDGDRQRQVPETARRRYLVAHMRIAAADRLIEQPDEIAAYVGAGFNTLALYDTDEGGLLKSESRIAYEVEFARDHGLHILLGKGTEPIGTVAAATDDEIRERLILWNAYGHDAIVGVFFLHDDACLIEATVERQRHLYAIAHGTVPEWYVFGMIGGVCYNLPAEEVARFFDPNVFDHLIVLMYPLDGGGLDLLTSADPDDDMRRYVRRYVEQVGEKFIVQLHRGQLAVLVIQAFAYHEDATGHVPRPVDIDIQATIGSAALRDIPGQEANRSLAYFLWDGSRGGLFGLWQRSDWMAAAESINRRSEDVVRPVDRQTP